MRYGMSDWKARRFIETAAALPHLPAISEALERGELGVDKVLELTRFAKVETEDGLIPWARQVSAARIRQEADVVRRGEPDEAANDDALRSVTWAFRDEGRRFEMHAELPAAQGAAVATAIDRVARTVPSMPDERGDLHMPARRADALVGLCSARLAEDPDPDRATVVVHARVGTADPSIGRRDRRRRGGAPLDPRTAALRGPRRDRARGRRGPRHRHGTDHARSRRRGCSGRSGIATVDVGSLGAAPRRSPRRTTSCSGATADRPTSTISPPSARGTTSSSTNTGGGSRAAPRATSGGTDPTGRATWPVLPGARSAGPQRDRVISTQRKSRDSRRSASTLPPVWQSGQYVTS